MSSREEKPARTQADVAKTMGLSQSTVSLALRGDARIPEERRRAVQEVAETMGYRPSSAASKLASLRHKRVASAHGEPIGWINFWDQPARFHRLKEYHQYYLGARETAEKLGYRLSEFTSQGNITPKRLEGILRARGIEGLILPPHPVSFPFDGFAWDSFSFIKLGHSISDPVGHTVTADQSYNAILAYESISARGYRRIGYIEGTYRRLLFDSGFLKAQQRSPIEDRLPILKLKSNMPVEAKKEIGGWLETWRPDAILTSSGLVPGLIKDLGIKVPGGLSIASTSIWDGGVNAGIEQNPFEIGRVGMLSLISILHDNDRGIPALHREIMIKGTWVDGDSLPVRD